jgi:hypothetical protein
MEPLQRVVTTFKEFRGVYEHHKAEALARHLRTVADLVDRASGVRPCSKCGDQSRLLSLQEGVSEMGALREGLWLTELEVDWKR